MTQRGKRQDRLEHIAEKVELLQVDMAQHKAQDEAMYGKLDDVKAGITETNQLLREYGDRLGEYNKQLAVHIANNAELKQQSQAQAEGIKTMYEAIDTRLQKVEAPHKWAAITYNIMKGCVLLAGFTSAIYGAIKFLESHRPF